MDASKATVTQDVHPPPTGYTPLYHISRKGHQKVGVSPSAHQGKRVNHNNKLSSKHKTLQQADPAKQNCCHHYMQETFLDEGVATGDQPDSPLTKDGCPMSFNSNAGAKKRENEASRNLIS